MGVSPDFIAHSEGIAYFEVDYFEVPLSRSVNASFSARKAQRKADHDLSISFLFSLQVSSARLSSRGVKNAVSDFSLGGTNWVCSLGRYQFCVAYSETSK